MKTTSINLKEVEMHSYPVVIIGSGLAGLLAAIIAARSGEKVAVITKEKPGKASNTAYSMGNFSAAVEELTGDEHYEMSLETGNSLNDRQLLEKMIRLAPEVIECMSEELNLNFSKHKTGYIVADGDKPLAGANLSEKVVVKAMEEENIVFYSNCLPLELMVKDGVCGGVLALGKNGEFVSFRSKALLIATGGYAGSFEHTDNHPALMGEGLMLGYRAGGALRDLEFVQFYPLGFNEEALPKFIAPPRYPINGKIYNDSGEDIILKYLGEEWDINSATMWKRQDLSHYIEKEWKKEQVWMDLTKCDEKDWKGVNSKPLYDRYRFDFNQYPFRVGPLAHYTPGGLSIDISLNTGIDGLFAAGEVTGGVHGEDRMGGNGLTEAACFGREAGKEMVNYISGKDYFIEKDEELSFINPIFSLYLNDRFHLPPYFKEGNCEELKKRVKKMYWKAINPIWNERNMEAVLEELEEYRKIILPPESLNEDSAVTLDKAEELKELVTLEMASNLLELCVKSARMRKNFKKSDEGNRKNIFWQQGKVFYRLVD